MTKERLKELLAGVANADTAPAFISDLDAEAGALIDTVEALSAKVSEYETRITDLTATNNKLLIDRVLNSENIPAEEEEEEKTAEEELADFVKEMAEYMENKE